MSYLTDATIALAAAMPAGIRVTSDPAGIVPPCLALDHTPKYVRPSSCGPVWEWTCHLIPAVSTEHAAARWLADVLPDVLDAIPGSGAITAEPIIYQLTDEDRAAGVPAYEITYHA